MSILGSGRLAEARQRLEEDLRVTAALILLASVYLIVWQGCPFFGSLFRED
jgi:hypothetical protein